MAEVDDEVTGNDPSAVFKEELQRLVATFERNLALYKSAGYDEASLRQEFLNPFFRTLGWDVENTAGRIPSQREVELESRTTIAGRQKRADYLFRADGRDRFVCEAKRPVEDLDAAYAFQAKRYAWNKDLPLAVLTDFEELKVYVVGSKPHVAEPEVGLWRTWSFRQYLEAAPEIWNLLARERVAGGSIEALLEGLPRKPAVRGRARQPYLIKPDRTRALDADFLNFLDEARRGLAADLVRQNDRADLLEGNRLNEAVQRILDRILFLRICEDRDIDTGTRLEGIVRGWEQDQERPVERRARQRLLAREDEAQYVGQKARRAPPESLWQAVVRHFRALDRRPPTHVPFFNGNLFKEHFCENLRVGDPWLVDFIDELSDEASPYLFSLIPVEILGTIYERFLGKVVRPQGRGMTIEEKPEVRKAGGVYYTPRYIVDYIVEQTVGRLLADKSPEASLKLRILDPACGSGSFLIRAFERVCEHWQHWLTRNPEKRKKSWCWTDPETGDVHLTVDLKRRILTATIYGVDLDPGAVEVTQLSLYLKMLEGENRTTLARERELFGGENALLPPLEDNIKCGNSLIASDFTMIPEDLIRVRAFDWPVQFSDVMKSGGFDAIVGNPPYIRIQTLQETDPETVAHLNSHYRAAAKGNYDIYVVFVERALSLLNPSGRLGYILPHKFLNAQYGGALRQLLAAGKHLAGIVHFGDQQVFEGATTYTCLLFLTRTETAKFWLRKVNDLEAWQRDEQAVTGEVRASETGTTEWNFHVGPEAALFNKLLSVRTTLGGIASRMAQGIRTSANEVYVLDILQAGARVIRARSEILQREVKVERNMISRFLQGRDIKRYALLDSGKAVIIPYHQQQGGWELVPEKVLRESAPNTYDYIRENKSHLEGRERGRMRGYGWYGYIYPKNIDVMRAPKILVPDIADRASYALDEAGEFAFTSGYGITLKREVKVSAKFVLDLLNSKVLDFFLKKISTTMRGGFFRYFTQFIEKLPIVLLDFSKPTDRARHNRMVELVDKMLALVPKLRVAKDERERAALQNAVDATDRQIDQLVYELYGLTPAEIALVEGGGAPQSEKAAARRL